MSAPEPTSFAHFRVLRRANGASWLLGVGGMGMTYKAHDTRLRTDVALKVIHPSRLGDLETQRLFLREARAAAKVHHENVAAVTFLEDSGTLFYAMEFIDGVSLQRWQQRHGRLALGQALAFAEQIAHGLAAIHDAGLIHRDLKPTNLMLVEYPPGTPRHEAFAASGGCLLKIIDFGLARPTDTSIHNPDDPTATISFRGTSIYASPEQCAERKDLDGRSDLYALGCVIWEMLTGSPPFRGRSHRDMVHYHLNVAPNWTQLGAIPPATRELLERLLAKDREQRPATANATVQLIARARQEWSDLHGAAPAEVPPARAPSTAATVPTPGVPAPAPTPAATAATAPSTPASPPTTSGTSITIALPPRWWIGAASFAGVVLAAGVAALILLRRPSAEPAHRARGVEQPNLPVEAIRPPTQAQPTVALLRFTAAEGDAGGADFARGMTEDLLSSLHKVRGLRVISLNASAPPADAARLGLSGPRTAFLEGKVRRQGSQLRIHARLTEADSQRQLWAESFDRELVDSFEIQESVARQIARALATNLTEEEGRSLARRPTQNARAYELLLEGRDRWHAGPRTLAVNERIVELCAEASRLDPKFALAWAYEARAHNVIYFYAFDRSPARLARARLCAETALKLQPDLAEAHLAFARVQWFESPEPAALLPTYRAALAIAPDHAEILYAISDVYRQLQQPEESLRLAREAAERAPDDPSKVGRVGDRLSLLRRYGAAEEWYLRAMELSKDNPVRVVRYELCRAERTGDWSRYTEKVGALIPKLSPESRWIEQLRLRDFGGALATIQALPGADLAYQQERVPKTLVTAFLHRRLGDEGRARADGQAAAEAMQSSKVRPLMERPWKANIALALGRAGRSEEARRLADGTLNQISLERNLDDGVSAIEHLLILYVELGDKPRAVQMVRKLFSVPTTWSSPILLRHSPYYDGLRGEPEFEALLAERQREARGER
ncbi:MAG: protein kinase [Verrucomicrobia bacterium]|nr:protein kinase [Verrucomicrobiota bacterium]